MSSSVIVATVAGQLVAGACVVRLLWGTARGAESEVRSELLEALATAVADKDPYTRDHSDRVATAAVMLAREIGLTPRQIEQVRYAGLLHDIGKLGVPTDVLRKEHSLTAVEQTAVARHPARGAELIADVEFLLPARDGIRHHHERMDGRGYPAGLAGPDIPISARIVAIADAFDAMTSDRPYREGRPVEDAIAELRRRSGDQFDADFVEAFVRAVNEHGWPVDEATHEATHRHASSVLPAPREPK